MSCDRRRGYRKEKDNDEADDVVVVDDAGVDREKAS